MKKILLLSLVAYLCAVADLSAADRYWIASSTANWNSTANWSTSSGGASGASVPGSGDVARFDANGTGNCDIDANVNVSGMNVGSGYTGTISQGTYTITLGTTGGVFAGGTFTGGSATITATGAVTISGTAFTNTSGNFTTNSNFTLSSGSFTHNSGTFTSTATSTIAGTIDFYNVTFTPSSGSTYTVSNTITVNGTFTMSGSNDITINTGTIDTKGNITITNNANGGAGSGTVSITGNSNQTLDGPSSDNLGRLPNVTINKSGGTLYLVDHISVTGDWTYTSGTIDEGSSTVFFRSNLTIDGSHELYNVTFSGAVTSTYVINSGTILTVNGTFTITGNNVATINTGTIHAKGDISHTSPVTSGTGGSYVLVINGSGNQTFNGSGTATAGRINDIEINKSGGTLTLVDNIQVYGDFTYVTNVGSSLNATNSTVGFVLSKTITGSFALGNVTFSGGATYAIVSSGILTVGGTLTLGGSSALIINGSGAIYAQGDVNITNTSTGSVGNIMFVFNGTGTQTLTGSGTAGAGRLSGVTIDKTNGTLTLQSVISVAGDWIYTQGSVTSTGSTVAFYGSFNLDGQHTSTTACMPFYDVFVNTGTRTLTGNVDIDRNFTITSGATCSAGSNTLFIGGNWNSAGTWTYGTSTVVFDGDNYNNNTIEGTGTVNFATVRLSRRTTLGTSTKNLRLLDPVQVNTAMTFTLGRLRTDTINYLQFADNATCTVSNDDSTYVHGPVRKVGNDAFSFPLGDTTLHDSIAYHPLVITAPSSATDRFQASYRATGQTLGDSLVDTLSSISDCEYWSIKEQVGTSNVYVTVYWNRNSCNVNNYNDMRLAGWNGVKWLDLGVSNLAPGAPTGSLRTSSTVAFSSQSTWNVVIGQRPNSSPYAVLKKKIDAGYYQCNDGKLQFRFDDEYNDPDAKLTFRIYNDAYGLVANDQWIAAGYVPNVYYGSNYYLLNVLDCNVVPNGNALNGFFILEVINEKNERWYLRFKNTTSLNPNCTGSGEETE